MLKFVKTLVAKGRELLTREPALSLGSVVAAGGVVVTWVQTNHITTVREAVTLALPIVFAAIIRQVVASPATVQKFVADLNAKDAVINHLVNGVLNDPKALVAQLAPAVKEINDKAQAPPAK
jgi:hypothetical protein